MPTKNPRIMVVLEPALRDWVKKSARSQGVSLSQAVRDLVRDAYMEHEDAHWAAEGDARLASLKKDETVSHEDAWK